GNPWDQIGENITEGQQVSGSVTKLDNYGFFVELSPGIVGLVYLTEIDWVNKSPKPSKYVSVGDKVNVEILALDLEKRRISLGYKQCQQNPWVDYANNHSVGDIITAPVNRFNKHGLFLAINDNLDGFVHISNIDWDSSQEDVLKKYSKGDVVKAQITIIDPQKGKIALSIKKVTPNVFMDFGKKYDLKKSVIVCKVKSIENKQVIVSLENELDGIIMASELGGDRMKDPADICKVGDELTAMLWRMDAKSKRIYLSVRAITEQDDKEAMAEQKKKKTGFLSTFADILHIGSKSNDDKTPEDKTPEDKTPEDKTAEATEDKVEAVAEDKAAEATEDKPEAVAEDKGAEATEDKPEAVAEDKGAEATEDKPEAVAEDKGAEATEDKPEAVAEDKAAEATEDTANTEEKDKE
ncbi:MAG: S1 RNA-binding domain-containing protein, partial [Candidatus Portiera sp.]|nr:S1 RNA-binding domain-containing protein [Portiera sp.]